MQTLLLSVLLASLSTMPTAMHLGLRVREWLDVVLNLRSVRVLVAPNGKGLMRAVHRAHNAQEMYLASTTIGAALGAYAGALPIPLDWDRPWQVSVRESKSCCPR